MEVSFKEFGEYGVLGILLLAAGWTIRHLYLQLDDRTKEFAKNVEGISDKNLEVHRSLVEKIDEINERNIEANKDQADKFVGLYEKTMRDFREMHTKSLDALRGKDG